MANKVKQKTEQPSSLLFNVESNVHHEKRLTGPCDITRTDIPYLRFFWSAPTGGVFPARGRGMEWAKD